MSDAECDGTRPNRRPDMMLTWTRTCMAIMALAGVFIVQVEESGSPKSLGGASILAMTILGLWLREEIIAELRKRDKR